MADYGHSFPEQQRFGRSDPECLLIDPSGRDDRKCPDRSNTLNGATVDY
ncbi:MAG: hypothetical protein WAN11_04490 [Syntrophobacteraceae bacterium]